MRYEEMMFDKQAEFNIKIKEMELEITKLEAKWSSWLNLPKTIIKLPVYCLMAIGYIISSIRNHEVSKDFWNFLNK